MFCGMYHLHRGENASVHGEFHITLSVLDAAVISNTSAIAMILTTSRAVSTTVAYRKDNLVVVEWFHGRVSEYLWQVDRKRYHFSVNTKTSCSSCVVTCYNGRGKSTKVLRPPSTATVIGKDATPRFPLTL